jgi:hypothetical protein
MRERIALIAVEQSMAGPVATARDVSPLSDEREVTRNEREMHTSMPSCTIQTFTRGASAPSGH